MPRRGAHFYGWSESRRPSAELPAITATRVCACQRRRMTRRRSCGVKDNRTTLFRCATRCSPTVKLAQGHAGRIDVNRSATRAFPLNTSPVNACLVFTACYLPARHSHCYGTPETHVTIATAARRRQFLIRQRPS